MNKFQTLIPRFALATILLCLCQLGVAQQTHSVLDSLARDAVRQSHAPSISVAVIRPDTIYVGQHGKLRIDRDTPVSLDTQYHLGSNTKAVTSLLAFQQIELGKLALHSKFLDYFPGLRKLAEQSGYGEITLGDLLSHRAGIPAFTAGVDYVGVGPFTGSIQEQRLAFARVVLSRKPVETGTYSNAGFVLAAMMLELVTAKSYEENVADLMKELELEHGFGFPSKYGVGNAFGHWIEKGELTVIENDNSYQLAAYMAPAGDLSMNIVDYAHFVQEHLNGIEGHSKLLTDYAYSVMHFEEDKTGYGWANLLPAQRVSIHDGSIGTFYAHTIVSPDNLAAVVVLSNAAEPNHVDAIYKLRQAVIDGLHHFD